MSAGSKTSRALAALEWRPGAGLPALRARAAMLADLRRHFAALGVMEVETPLACSSSATDPSLQPMLARYQGPVHPAGTDLYLQTSPEFAMKRLLAAGSGPIYQICKAFRNGEVGRLHNPEFTILEWYRPGYDSDRLMAEVADLVRLAVQQPHLAVDVCRYADLFAAEFGIDVFETTIEQLRGVARSRDVFGAESLDLDLDGWLDLLLSHFIQPGLGQHGLCFVTDYPASQAALARINPDGRSAARFELFWRGIELANGYQELLDADEQAARFEADNCRRRAAGLPPLRVDFQLLGALQHGLPACAGVAVGLDRVLMLRLGEDDLDAVLSFSLQRC